MVEAIRWPVLHGDSRARLGGELRAGDASAWRAEPGRLSLVRDAGEVPALIAEAARWAERISVCVSGPQSGRGSSLWWRELLARSTKFEAVFVRRPEQAEGWLLHRLQAAGCLRLVEAGGRQVASNLLSFARGGEVRALLSHVPLERALAGVGFGTLLCFRGSADDELGRACRAQVESWAELGRIPTGSELDALMFDPRRRSAVASFDPPRSFRVLTEPRDLAVVLARWEEAGAGARVRPFAGGYRLVSEGGAFPLALSLHAGVGWGAGNALLVEVGARELLVWRGGLLGPSRARGELCWGESRFPSFVLECGALGLSERVAVVAETSAPLGPQLEAFARELGRLGELFGVEPPPALAHVLSDFATLSLKQQTLLAWRALIGAGPLELHVAARLVAESLRDQGYLRGELFAAGSTPCVALAELLSQAVEAGRAFDRPSPGMVRAIQPELARYSQDDWLACLLAALPEGVAVERRLALRGAFEQACARWGLRAERLVPGGGVERALEACVSSALVRGLLVRVGAGALLRPGRGGIELARPAPVGESVLGFVEGWARAIDALAPVQRFVVTRRAGWYGKRESLESVAQRLGLAPERARQIEVDAWQQIAAGSSWALTLRTRLERALGGTRAVAVRRLVLDDAWWRGAEQHLDLCEAAFEHICGGELWRVELAGANGREAFFARFAPWDLERTFATLLERAAAIATPAIEADYRAACDAAAADLDRGLSEYLHDALAPYLELDPDDPTRVLRFVDAARPLDVLPAPARGMDSEALLRLEDVVRSIFRSAGTPLSLSAIAERVRARLDVSESMLAERLAAAPFVQRNSDQYGLITRDVPGGAEAIANVLGDIVDTLVARQRALTPNQAVALAEVHVKHAWSHELLASLIAGDPALYRSAAGDTTLRRWQHARLLPHGAPICPGVPASLRPRFEKLVQQPPASAEALVRRIRSAFERLDRLTDGDELFALPLGRELCDLCERLLEHVSGAPEHELALPEPTSSTPASSATLRSEPETPAAASAPVFAAIECVLDALTADEEEIDAPPLDGQKLAAARAVVAAVSSWLGLDWLELAPPSRRQRPNPSLAGEPQSGTPMR